MRFQFLVKEIWYRLGSVSVFMVNEVGLCRPELDTNRFLGEVGFMA